MNPPAACPGPAERRDGIRPGLRIDQIEVLHGGQPCRVGARGWTCRTWWVRCSCGVVALRREPHIRRSLEDGRACCKACRSVRAARSMRRGQLRAYWAAFGSLYDPIEIEQITGEVREALALELGAPDDGADGLSPEDLRRGQRGEVYLPLDLPRPPSQISGYAGPSPWMWR